MIVDFTEALAMDVFVIAGAVVANIFAIVRIWHKIELRLAVIEARVNEIQHQVRRKTWHATDTAGPDVHN